MSSPISDYDQFKLRNRLRTLFTDIWVILDGKNGSGVPPCTYTCLKAKLQKTMKIHSHGSIIWSMWEALWVRIAQIQKLWHFLMGYITHFAVARSTKMRTLEGSTWEKVIPSSPLTLERPVLILRCPSGCANKKNRGFPGVIGLIWSKV